MDTSILGLHLPSQESGETGRPEASHPSVTWRLSQVLGKSFDAAPSHAAFPSQPCHTAQAKAPPLPAKAGCPLRGSESEGRPCRYAGVRATSTCLPGLGQGWGQPLLSSSHMGLVRKVTGCDDQVGRTHQLLKLKLIVSAERRYP